MGISELSSFCAVVEPICDKAPGELVAKASEICKPGVSVAALRAADPHCACALPADMAQTAIQASKSYRRDHQQISGISCLGSSSFPRFES
jgi:hypothetical protein